MAKSPAVIGANGLAGEDQQQNTRPNRTFCLYPPGLSCSPVLRRSVEMVCSTVLTPERVFACGPCLLRISLSL
jgi:hypothetical protein